MALDSDIGLSHLCGEEVRLCRFHPDPESPYAQRLKQYKDTDRYYPGKSFAVLTDGIGCTRTFRACLNEFIKSFEPHPFPGKTEWKVTLKTDGNFVLEGPGAEREQSGEEGTLFGFLCFLHVNVFWSRVETLRGCRLADSPLIVENKDGWVTQSCGEELLTRLREERQIIIV